MIDWIIGAVVITTWNGFLFYKMVSNGNTTNDGNRGTRSMDGVQTPKDENCRPCNDYPNARR